MIAVADTADLSKKLKETNTNSSGNKSGKNGVVAA